VQKQIKSNQNMIILNKSDKIKLDSYSLNNLNKKNAINSTLDSIHIINNQNVHSNKFAVNVTNPVQAYIPRNLNIHDELEPFSRVSHNFSYKIEKK
jgi:hypothetical protein